MASCSPKRQIAWRRSGGYWTRTIAGGPELRGRTLRPAGTWARSSSRADGSGPPVGQEDLRVAGPVPEQTVWSARLQLGADVGLEGIQPAAEEVGRGERRGEVVGEHSIDVLDDVGAAGREDALRPAEPGASEGILVSIDRRRRETLPGAPA